MFSCFGETIGHGWLFWMGFFPHNQPYVPHPMGFVQRCSKKWSMNNRRHPWKVSDNSSTTILGLLTKTTGLVMSQHWEVYPRFQPDLFELDEAEERPQTSWVGSKKEKRCQKYQGTKREIIESRKMPLNQMKCPVTILCRCSGNAHFMDCAPYGDLDFLSSFTCLNFIQLSEIPENQNSVTSIIVTGWELKKEIRRWRERACWKQFDWSRCSNWQTDFFFGMLVWSFMILTTD